MSSDSTIRNLLSINNDLLVFKRLVLTMKRIQAHNDITPLVDAPAHYDNSHAFAYQSGHSAGVAQTIDMLLEIASKATPDITGEG